MGKLPTTIHKQDGGTNDTYGKYDTCHKRVIY